MKKLILAAILVLVYGRPAPASTTYGYDVGSVTNVAVTVTIQPFPGSNPITGSAYSPVTFSFPLNSECGQQALKSYTGETLVVPSSSHGVPTNVNGCYY